MKKTLDLLIPTLWQVKAGFKTNLKHSSLKPANSLSSSVSEEIGVIVEEPEVLQPISVIIPEKIIAEPTPVSQLAAQSPKIVENDNWEVLQAEMLACDKCGLCNGRTHVVIEKGNRQSKWMFIGEAPGENEDLQGVPFVGDSGNLLGKMISAMGLDINQDVYITNIIKCRPPKNRNPEANEILQCQDYLYRQIRLIQPQIIITLGRFAAQALLNSTLAIGKLRNQVHNFDNIPVVVTFHPDYLLRKPEDKKLAWDDLQLAMKTMQSQG